MKAKYLLTQIILIIAVCVYSSTCFDDNGNKETGGFSKNFLNMSDVIETCHDSHLDMKKSGMVDLHFCKFVKDELLNWQ